MRVETATTIFTAVPLALDTAADMPTHAVPIRAVQE